MCVEVLFSFIIYLPILHVPHSLWDLSFLTREAICTHCIGSTES